MNKTHTLLTLALAGLLAAPTVLRAEDAKPTEPAGEAKPGPGGPGGGDRQRMNPEERLKMMKETLGLTDEQAAKVKAIIDKNRETMAKLREDQSLSREDRQAKVREMRKGETEEVKALLTPEQQEKIKGNLKRRQEGDAPDAAK